MTDNLKISSPWVTYARKINALFDQDPEVLVEYDNDGPEVKLYVDNYAKAEALTELMPTEKTFGNIVLKITVIPANEITKIGLFRNAFAGNPIVDKIETVPFAENAPINYIIFAREVVSFFNDDMNDFFGLESTLYEDLARDIFEVGDGGICFCTNVEDTQKEGLQCPLGEWP